MKQCKTNSLFTVLWSFAVIMLLAMQPVRAVDDLGLFELEGNAVHDGWLPTANGDDWATLHGGGGSANVFTGITADAAPMSIFDGGKKDIQEVQGTWSWKHGAVPDKNDITNAYAAAYTATANMFPTAAGDTIIYFGADRFANAGDAFLGFWFFKNEIIAEDDGSFSGFHAIGDVLVLVNFPQGANAVPLIQVVTWDPSCSKADNNSPQPGDCAAKNLLLVAGASGAGAVCSGAGGLFCAVTNDENGPYDPTLSPWAYTPKAGLAGSFPYESFFEGGINLTKLFPNSDGCFSSFLAETRSSSSFTASLKDFVLDSFPLCSIEVSKVCSNGRLNAAEDGIIYDINGTVTNTGPGTVYNIVVIDTPSFATGPAYTPADNSILAGGATIDYSGTIEVTLANNGAGDRVDATANTKADNTGTVLNAFDTDTCPLLQVNPAASVIKDCESIVSIIDLVDPVQPGVVAEVNVGGMVCNTGDSRLDQVTVTDNKAGVLLGPISMEKQTCENYTGSYIPQAALDIGGTPTNDPTAVVFKDTVTVTAVDIFGEDLSSPLPTAMATCPLCPVPE